MLGNKDTSDKSIIFKLDGTTAKVFVKKSLCGSKIPGTSSCPVEEYRLFWTKSGCNIFVEKQLDCYVFKLCPMVPSNAFIFGTTIKSFCTQCCKEREPR